MSDTAVHEDPELQQQLDEKDQLIRALTDRLEEAAEQLDRVNRSGGNKQGTGGSRSAGGSSSEMLAQQQKIIDQLEKSAELWEDVQPRDAFTRLEEQLDDLRQLLESSTVSKRDDGISQAPKPPKANQLSGWEKMKAELMGETPADPKPANPKPASSPPPTPSTTAPVSAQPAPPVVAPTNPVSPVFSEPLTPLSELHLPEPVDFDVAERRDLEEAIETRDQYIGELTRRLRSAESRTQQKIDWSELNNAPDVLRETLESLEAELNDRLRIAEVDLSLERARLARVEARIHCMQKQFEEKLKASGPPQTTAPRKAEESASQPSHSKSWFGSLGR